MANRAGRPRKFPALAWLGRGLGLAALLLGSLVTHAQDPTRKSLQSPARITAASGQTKLPKAKRTFQDASIGCAIQDKAGNLWFGTNGEELFRYDGQRFTQFTEKDGLSPHLIYSLLEDRDGHLWVGTKTGLYRSDGKTFTNVPFAPKNAPSFLAGIVLSRPASPTNGVWSIMQDRKGTIWFGTDDGVYCFDGTDFTFFLDQGVSNPDKLHLRAIFSILEDRKGNVWFGSCIGEGLLLFDGKTLRRISPKGYARTQNLVEDENGSIWFGSVSKGMCRYDGRTIDTNFFREQGACTDLYTILKDHAGNLWFSWPTCNQPPRIYDGKKCIRFAEQHRLPVNNVYPVLADNQGGIWFAAKRMGLYRWDGKAVSTFSE